MARLPRNTSGSAHAKMKQATGARAWASSIDLVDAAVTGRIDMSFGAGLRLTATR